MTKCPNCGQEKREKPIITTKNLEELKSVAEEHIMYEFKMFKDAYVGCTNGKDNCGNNVLLESFILHFCNLHSFFFKFQNNDDVSYLHYTDNIRIENIDTKFKDLEKYYQQRNKLLSHITWSRLGKDKTWELQNMHQSMIELWNIFILNLDIDRKKWFLVE